MKTIVALLAITVGVLGWNYAHRPLVYEPGVLVPADPLQTPTADLPFTYGKFTLKPLARFIADARLLHRKNYHFDRQADLVPVDLAIGWGAMSDQRVLDQLTITQSMRFYWFQYKMPPPISAEEIIAHSTNIHIIPATPEIAARCKSLRAGMLIHLDGDLVEASAPDYGTWRSSLSRTDTGNGACELIWLKELSVLSQAK